MGAIELGRLGRWYQTHGPRLVLYARQWLGADGAQDVVQDAFVRLMAQRRRPDNISAWLFRCVRNLAISRLRARTYRRRREAQVARDRPAWFDARPEDLVDAQTAAAMVAHLPLDQREVIILRIWGELTFREIAEIVGSTVTTAFRRYGRGLNQIRQALEKPCTAKKD